MNNKSPLLNGIVRSSFTHPQVVPNLYDFLVFNLIFSILEKYGKDDFFFFKNI